MVLAAWKPTQSHGQPQPQPAVTEKTKQHKRRREKQSLWFPNPDRTGNRVHIQQAPNLGFPTSRSEKTQRWTSDRTPTLCRIPAPHRTNLSEARAWYLVLQNRIEEGYLWKSRSHGFWFSSKAWRRSSIFLCLGWRWTKLWLWSNKVRTRADKGQREPWEREKERERIGTPDLNGTIKLYSIWFRVR